MAPDSKEPIERWTAKHRAALILSTLSGGAPLAEAAQEHGLAVAETKVRQGTLSTGCQERPAQPVEGQRGPQGQADQKAEPEDRRVRVAQ